MTRFLRVAAVVVSLTSLGFVAGCKQGVGDRCQTADDCDDGLLCVLANGATYQAGGTCEPEGSLIGDMGSDMSVVDMAHVQDASQAADGG